MRPRIKRNCLSQKLAPVLCAIACLCLTAISTLAASSISRVIVRDNVSQAHREELVTRLSAITGLTDLKFDSEGSLLLGSNSSSRGSEAARKLLAQAGAGANVIILEDASSRSDVAFCRVVRGRWTSGDAGKPPAYVVLIDFTDFQQLTGDAEARAAFDVGWGLLHEIDHVVTGSEDAENVEAIGDCEDHINAMRLEVGLPVRADYFFTRASFKADSNFNARYVRLSFERRDDSSFQRKRYWLIWDAVTVGGLIGDGQRALVR
jgi:hypothetical protein